MARGWIAGVLGTVMLGVGILFVLGKAAKASSGGDWTHFNDQVPLVAKARRSAEWPLSDQDNSGHWLKNEPMSDEFNGTELDRTKWHYNIGDWRGPQPCWYSDKNVELRGGLLHMILRYDVPPSDLAKQGYNTYSGAALTSMATASEGYFEARAKPSKSHASSAFWFHHNVDKWWHEIDVFEIGGNSPGKEHDMNIGVHVFRSPVEAKFQNVDGPFRSAVPLADNFHVYGLEWNHDELKFYFDGHLVLKGPNRWWHQESHLSFDTDIIKGWFGMPEPSELPADFQVDYVRAWKKSR